MSQGDIRGDNRQTDEWLLRMMGRLSPNVSGLSSNGIGQAPIGGGSLRGYGARGGISPIQSSTWQARVGLGPSNSYDGGVEGGESRVNTSRSAGIYKNKKKISDSDYVQTYSKDGAVDYGGNRNTFEFKQGDSDYNTIAESGNIGLRAQDRSGQAIASNPMSNLSDEQQWNKLESLGGDGFSSEQGFYKAKLDNPSDRIVFNNRINQNLSGRGNVDTQVLADSEGNKVSKTLSDKINAVPILSKIPLIGKAFKSHDNERLTQYTADTTANQNMSSGGYLDAPGTAEYGVQSEGQQRLGMKTSDIGNVLSQSMVSGDQSGRLAMDRSGAGFLSQQNYANASGGAGLQDQEHEWKKMFHGEKQNRDVRGGPTQLEASAGLLSEGGVSSNQALKQNISQDWIAKNINKDLIDNWDTYRSRYPGLYSQYQDAGDYVTKMYAKANPQAQVNFSNQSQAVQSASANGVSSSIDAKAAAEGSMAASGKGVKGGFQQAVDSFAQDPSSFVMTPYGTPAYVVGLKHWSQNATTNLTGDMKGDSAVLDTMVKIGGNLTQNNELHQEMMRSVEDISSKMPQTEWGQMIIQKMKDSPELALLFNSNSSPETIAKTIVNYDVYKNETSAGWNVIPGIGAAPIYGAPVTTSNLNAQTNLDTKVKRSTVQQYDPTPDSPNSGDEVWLTNVNGNVKELQAGKLISQNYTDTLNTQMTTPQTSSWSGQQTTGMTADQLAQSQKQYTNDQAKYQQDLIKYQKDKATFDQTLKSIQALSIQRKIPLNMLIASAGLKAPVAPVAPIQKTQNVTQQVTNSTPINQQNQLNYQQFYYTPGQNQQYNQLATAALNRYYDDNAGYDYSGIDPLIQQIQTGYTSAQDGMYGGYSKADWDYVINLYNQQKQYDDTGYNQFGNYTSNSLTNQRYY